MLLVVIITVSLTAETAQQCNRHFESCEACLSSNWTCAWCAQTDMEKVSSHRCGDVDTMTDTCDPEYIVYHRSMVHTDNTSEVVAGDSKAAAIRITPRRLVLKLRPNDPVNFTVDLEPFAHYPVDLYFLMDLSYSMSDDKYKISQLGKALSKEMQRITKDFRIGFGSFVDKQVMPFVDTGPKFSQNSCPLESTHMDSSCVPAYNFKHHLSLTEDTDAFEAHVMGSRGSGNIDAPEGGMDALMQAMVCREIVGWRNNSRKIIVFLTDAGFHFAGDGKLAGITEPNDEQCHLEYVYDEYTKSHVHKYTHAEIQDYPSLGAIYFKLIENDMSLIFAVTERQVELYKLVSEFLENAVVGLLAEDSSNIVDLVANNYKKITSKIRMVMNVTGKDGEAIASDKIGVKMHPDCMREATNGSQQCDIGVGRKLGLNVSVEILECIGDSMTVSLHPYGVRSERLDVILDPLCACSCPARDGAEFDSKCAGHGRYRCGVCHCNEGYYGRGCECDGKNASTETLMQQCKRSESNIICSGRGQCVCGKCKCYTRGLDENISGEYCECDNFSCPRYKGKICSGSAQGSCTCDGTCSCKEGWSGHDCSCSTKVDSCIANSTGLICNGKGTCECGICVCNKMSDFLGPACEQCLTCQHGCQHTKDCVRCKVFQTGPLNKQQCDQCPFEFELVDSLEDSKHRSNQQRSCRFTDTDKCVYYYKYHYGIDQRMVLSIKKTKTCPVVLPIWLISTFVSSSVLMLGALAIVTWRIVVSIQERNEFLEFEKEHAKAKWEHETNPIYRKASVTYPNPLYQRRHKPST